MNYDVIVIGGGPAGMFAAITAAGNGKKVLLLERNDRLGRKLLITGKGRCNVTNNCDIQEVMQNIPRNCRFLYSALTEFPPKRIMEFFERAGCELKTERGNRVFPATDKAQSVLDALRSEMNRKGVAVRTGRARCILTDETGVIGVETDRERIGGRAVILATGHGSRDEIDKLVRAAATRGVQRIMINHPHYMIGASLEDMVAWSRLGAYIELNAVAFVPDSKFYSNKIEEAGAIIESVGLDKIVVDSDYGQNGNGSPVTGMQRFVALLQEHCGLSEADVEQICYKNPCHLLSIDAE